MLSRRPQTLSSRLLVVPPTVENTLSNSKYVKLVSSPGNKYLKTIRQPTPDITIGKDGDESNSVCKDCKSSYICWPLSLYSNIQFNKINKSLIRN